MNLKTILNALLATLILSASMAGCLESEEDEKVIRIAFKTQDDYDNPSANPQILADFIAAQSG